MNAPIQKKLFRNAIRAYIKNELLEMNGKENQLFSDEEIKEELERRHDMVYYRLDHRAE